VLYVAGRQRIGSELAEALATQSDSTIFLEEALGVAAGMARLHDEAFDIVLAAHEPDGLDALALAAGIRASGGDEPVIVFGIEPQHELLADCLAAGAETYLCVAATTPQALAWTVAKSTDRLALVRDYRRLVDAQRQRQEQDQVEVRRLLEEQSAALTGLAGTNTPLPSRLMDRYRELLRAYIVMGSGHLTDELSVLVQQIAAAEVSASQTMQMHLQVLDELVRSLGNRSARHALARADLLALEVVVRLGEVYLRRAVVGQEGTGVREREGLRVGR